MKVIRRLPPHQVEEIKLHISTHLHPLAKPEKAKCASGRMQLWLEAEPDYRNKTYMPGYRDDRLWSFCKRLFPSADLAQLYFADDMHGIDWHGDAAYAAVDACILNLGKVRLEWKSYDQVHGLDLEGGEVIQFNCKLPHRAIPHEESRVGIGMWKAAIKIPGSTPVHHVNLPEYPVEPQWVHTNAFRWGLWDDETGCVAKPEKVAVYGNRLADAGVQGETLNDFAMRSYTSGYKASRF